MCIICQDPLPPIGDLKDIQFYSLLFINFEKEVLHVPNPSVSSVFPQKEKVKLLHSGKTKDKGSREALDLDKFGQIWTN